jgi:hypothetical protein
MNSLETSAIIFGCSFGMGLLGMLLNFKVPDHHLDVGSRDVVKLVLGLIATVSALVLSLLIASGSSHYQAQQNEVQSLSANTILLDRVLSFYGPDAKEPRDLLRQGLAAVHDRIWSSDGARTPELDPRATQGVAGDFLASLKSLEPKNDSQVTLKSQAMQIAQNLGQTRLLMYEQSGSSFAWPFLTVLVFWICMLFLGFGLHPLQCNSFGRAVHRCRLGGWCDFPYSGAQFPVRGVHATLRCAGTERFVPGREVAAACQWISEWFGRIRKAGSPAGRGASSTARLSR